MVAPFEMATRAEKSGLPARAAFFGAVCILFSVFDQPLQSPLFFRIAWAHLGGPSSASDAGFCRLETDVLSGSMNECNAVQQRLTLKLSDTKASNTIFHFRATNLD